jgi:hypothetical protein
MLCSMGMGVKRFTSPGVGRDAMLAAVFHLETETMNPDHLRALATLVQAVTMLLFVMLLWVGLLNPTAVGELLRAWPL